MSDDVKLIEVEVTKAMDAAIDLALAGTRAEVRRILPPEASEVAVRSVIAIRSAMQLGDLSPEAFSAALAFLAGDVDGELDEGAP